MELDLRPEAPLAVAEAVRRAALEVGLDAAVSPKAAAYASPWLRAALADAHEREPAPASTRARQRLLEEGE